jgi:integrase
MSRRDPRREIEALRDRLESGDRGDTERAREALLGLSDNLDLIPSEVGNYRHRDILRRCTIMAEAVGGDVLVDALDDREAAERVVRWINRTHDNEHTNLDYRKDLRSFGRYANTITEEPPESLSWIPSSTSNNFDPTPSERDLLTFEGDVEPMLEAASNDRDRALIALQFEAGLRSGELETLRVGDVFESEHTFAVHVDGKRGERVVHLTMSVPYLQRWLTEHPGSGDTEAPLWSKLDRPEPISYQMLRKIFVTTAERAGVRKPVTPTNFRKSNMRWLLLLGMKRGQIEQRQGRVHGSRATARYEAEFGEDSLERTYASLHGFDVDDTEDVVDVAPVTCPRCKQETPRDGSFCIHCAQALDLEAKELLDEAVEAFEQEAVTEPNADTRAELIDGARTLRRRPNLMGKDELHDLASSLSSRESEVEGEAD